MTRKTPTTPSYRLYKRTGQAVVSIDGRDFYLGPHGSETSKAEYDALVSRWLASGRKLDTPGPAGLTVVELIREYWRFVETYYVNADGDATPRVPQVRTALAIVKRLYGRTLAKDFGPVRLRTVRQAFVDGGWSRTYVNQQIHRVRRMFRWGVQNELLPADVIQSLQSLEGLRKGRGGRETPRVRPLADTVLDGTLKHASPMVAAMAQLQRVTGMRSGELVLLRGADLDMSGETWLYTPQRHKTAHLDYPRQIAIGPQGQSILRPWLKGDATAYVFSPRRSMELVRAARTAARKTPAGHGNVPGTNRVRHPERVPHERYTVGSYRRAIHYACDHAFPPPDGLADDEVRAWRADHRWGPHRLRHAYATEARRMGFSLEVIRAAMGHRGVQVTTLYAEADLGKSREIALKIG
jgi:integrase